MNWKDAKYQIAQNENYEDWKDLQSQCDLQFEVDCMEDAGMLMEKRIKELESAIKSFDETFAHLESITHGSDNNLIFGERKKIEQLLK